MTPREWQVELARLERIERVAVATSRAAYNARRPDPALDRAAREAEDAVAAHWKKRACAR